MAWRDMAGLRDRIVHGYLGVSLDIVWDVVANHLPALRAQAQARIRVAMMRGFRTP